MIQEETIALDKPNTATLISLPFCCEESQPEKLVRILSFFFQ
jgi:hypothetical protein